MRAYNYRENVFTFEGSVTVQVEDDWCKPWRIDFRQAEFFPYVCDKAEEASGVRISFGTNSENIGLMLYKVFEDMKLDLFVDGKLVEKYTCGQDKFVKFSKLDKKKKNVEIWLDPRFPFMLEKVLIDESASIAPVIVDKKRWVHYGSSISHSKSAESPSAIWAGIVSRRMNLHLTNLGYAGSCVMEPMVARMIRDLKADFISLKLGINCHSGSLMKRTFEPNAFGLVSIIREKHPETPLVVISPIISPDREDRRFFDSSLTLKEMREVLKAMVDKFQKHGDKWISYIDGLDILGADGLEYLPDKLHPDAQGQYVIADNYIRNTGKIIAGFI